MEHSIPNLSTKPPIQIPLPLPSPETSPKVVHFSSLHPTIYQEKQDQPLPEPPRQNFFQKLLSGFRLKQTQPLKVPRKKVASLPKKLPERKPLQKLTIEDLSLEKMQTSVEAQPYKWPHDGGFSPENTALIIIDMQRDFCSPTGYLAHQGYDLSPITTIIPTISSLLASFRTHSFPIFHTREGHRPSLSTLSSRELLRSRNNPSGLGIGDVGPLGRLLIRGEEGHEIISELEPREGEDVVDKPGKSAFRHTELELMLQVRGVRNLVLVGVTTDVCVSCTMRDANDLGFDCLLLEDATAASMESLHTATIEGIKAEGGIFGAVARSDKVLLALEVGGSVLGDK